MALNLRRQTEESHSKSIVARGHQISRGQHAAQPRIEDRHAVTPSIVRGRPSAAAFLKEMRSEMRLRFYQPDTIKAYAHAARSFLRWFGNAPHKATRNDVREYLLYLVDADAASGTVSNHLSAIRLLFDRFCNRAITDGLATPRKPKRLPVVPSKRQVITMLESATSLRDKLVLGLMYATGMRVSEVVRVRWNDVNFDRNCILIRQGKGRSDRQVVLPRSYRSIFRELSAQQSGDDFLFPGARSGRHLSPRTVERIMERTLRIAGIDKRFTPHSLRHAFATHSFEDGHDIRRIQKMLGHVRLETTTIYVKVAQPTDPNAFTSPIDQLAESQQPTPAAQRESVGSMRIHLQQQRNEDEQRVAKVTLEINSSSKPTYLTGIVARELRPGFVSLAIPPLESWQSELATLPTAQRDRMEETEFYLLLQQQIATRLASLPPETE